MFFAFAALLVGFCIDVRIIQQLFDSKIVHKTTTTVLKHSFFCIYFVLGTVFVKNLAFLWTVVVLLKLFLFFFEKILRMHRENKFNKSILLFVERVILFVQAGKSFRNALESAHDASDVFTQQRTRKILESVCFAQQTKLQGSTIDWIITELRQIDQNPHKVLSRLTQLREQLRIESDFRQKSDQVTMRFRTQSYIMCALYFAIFVFVVRNSELSRIWPMVFTSSVFFLGGFFWVYSSGKRMKWKI